MDNQLTNLEDYYIETHRQNRLVNEIKDKQKELVKLVNDAALDYISPSFAELWTELFGGKNLRGDRIVTPIKYRSSNASTTLVTLAIGKHIGYLDSWSTNASYFDTSPQKYPPYHYFDTLLNLIQIIHEHGVALSNYIPTSNLKREKFLALMNAINAHELHKVSRVQLDAYSPLELSVPLSPNDNYYLFTKSITSKIDLIKYQFTRLLVSLDSSNCKISVHIKDQPNHTLNLTSSYSIQHGIHQLHPFLMPIFNSMEKTLEANTNKYNREIQNIFSNIKQDLSKFLLLNSI